MANEEKQSQMELRYDVDGFDEITSMLTDLLPQFPSVEKIRFSFLGADKGYAWFPGTGAVIRNERVSITDHVRQECSYPFTIVFRASGLNEQKKKEVQNLLDSFGRWLELQTVTYRGEKLHLEGYPKLTGTRKVISINRETGAYLDSYNENKSENWIINMAVRYRNEFDR